MKVAEAQRLVAKAGAHEVELALHIERAANHLVLPGSLQGRVGEGGPVGLVRLWKACFGELRFEADIELRREIQFVEAEPAPGLRFGPLRRLLRRLFRRRLLLRARVGRGLRFGLRFSLFGLRLDAIGSVGRVLANSQREASYFLPIVIRRNEVDGQFGRAERQRERLSGVIFQALRRDDEEIGHIGRADENSQSAVTSRKRTIDGQLERLVGRY